MRTTAYRYPNERLILGVTLLVVAGVIALTATATVCASVLFIGIFLLMAYNSSRAHQQALMRAAHPVMAGTAPQLDRLVGLAAARLQPGPLEVYALPSQELNAYTFGLDTTKVLVLYTSLFETMDQDELLFIIGHEMGHVALGHTWLNSFVGGLAGIPSSLSSGALMTLAFLSWNRACEYSADRAGLLACGSPAAAVSALVKLAAGPGARSQAELDYAYRQADAEDDDLAGGLNEMLATHPRLIQRISQIRAYAASDQFRRLLARMAPDGGAAPRES